MSSVCNPVTLMKAAATQELRSAPTFATIVAAPKEEGAPSGGEAMPKYLFEVRYGAEAVKGLLRESATARREAAAKAIEGVGGKLEAFYFAYGEVDVYCIVELPDEAKAIGISMAVNQSGVMSGRLTPLIAPETVDAAAKAMPPFRPPGQ